MPSAEDRELSGSQLRSPKGLLVHYLRRLQEILEKLKSEGPEDILACRLAADMMPLETQVRIVANFALRIWCPLTAQPLVSFDNDEPTFEGLARQLQSTLEYIQFKEENDLNWGAIAQERAGVAEIRLAMPEFVYQYGLPNFYFHLSMVYAIARSAGVPLSKGDYDGYHQYPRGFSFN